jgi:hypothetical protein
MVEFDVFEGSDKVSVPGCEGSCPRHWLTATQQRMGHTDQPSVDTSSFPPNQACRCDLYLARAVFKVADTYQAIQLSMNLHYSCGLETYSSMLRFITHSLLL